MNIAIVSAAVSAALSATLVWQVQGWRWAERVANIERTHAQAMLAMEVDARAKERSMQKEAERIGYEFEKNERVFAERAAVAARVADGLRDEIARLNRRPAPADPGAASLAHEAAVARELLGACSAEYQAVARDADELRGQMTGLQDFVRSVLKTP